jgi:hypothetical protein
MLARFGPELASIAYGLIGEKVQATAEKVWEERKLGELRSWGREVVGGWWKGFYAGSFSALEVMEMI